MFRISRRGVLGMLMGAGTVLFAPARAFAQACRDAVIADEGPFYPVGPFPETTDLLGPQPPPGQILYLLGRVVDRSCVPVPGAVVEIWQCDAGGQYDHPRAPKTKILEKNFRYFAMTRAGVDGSFRFRTLRPAPYRVFGFQRAPHIHVRVKAPRGTLTTEIYFSGAQDAALRTTDSVFQGRGPRKEEMIVELKPASAVRARIDAAPEPGAAACECALVVRPRSEDLD
jgi:protocatechuate 3,4-dioxygenase beta subunit